MKRWERLEFLQRRADFLAARIVKDTKTDRTYDKAELSALLWAIKELSSYQRVKTANVSGEENEN